MVYKLLGKARFTTTEHRHRRLLTSVYILRPDKPGVEVSVNLPAIDPHSFPCYPLNISPDAQRVASEYLEGNDSVYH